VGTGQYNETTPVRSGGLSNSQSPITTKLYRKWQTNWSSTLRRPYDSVQPCSVSAPAGGGWWGFSYRTRR